MAQTANDVATTLNSNYKTTYANDLEEAIPDGVKVTPTMELLKGEQQQGGTYAQPVLLGLEHGFTYAAGDSVANLNAAVAGKLETATVTGYQIVGRAEFGWTVASRAVGPNKFRPAVGIVLESLMMSGKKRGEIALLYGQSGLGTVASVSGSILTMTASDFSEGHWVGMVGCPIEVYTSTTLTQQCKITKVDISTPSSPKLTVDNVGTIAAADVLYFRTAYGNECQGAYSALSTTTGNLFGISTTTYSDLWTGTTYGAGSAALTYAKVVRACAQALPRGGEGKFKFFLHPNSWQDLVNEPEVARVASDAYWTPKRIERGSNDIKFHSVAGEIELVPSTYVKRSHAFGFLQDGSWKRIGSTDWTMRIPGVNGGEPFYPLENAGGLGVRVYTDWAPFCRKIAGSVLITGITPSS